MNKEEKIKQLKREYMKEWRSRNRDKVNAYMREWRRNNKERNKEINERYWLKKLNNKADNDSQK